MRRVFSYALTAFITVNFLFLISSFFPTMANINNSFISPVNLNQSKEINTKVEDSAAINNFKDYNILLLGLDARHGDSRPRCDAIHIFSLSGESDSLIITSIPRGTKVDIPQTSTESAYIANNCHINGIDDTISKIEKISGIKIDAYVSVGFSEVIGLLRSINLPTTSTLQYLRNRRYVIGDYQRSHNQAMFLKDMILTHFEQVHNMPSDLRKFLFKSLNTNLDYDTAENIFEQFYKQKIYQNKDNIILVTKPERNKYVKDLHLDSDQSQTESPEEKSDFDNYQSDIENYLKELTAKSTNLIKSGKTTNAYDILKTPYNQNLWWQIEDEKVREDIHFNLFKAYYDSIPDANLKKQTFDEYMNELKLFNRQDYINRLNAVI